MREIVVDEKLSKELEAKIDPCGFETVKRYFRDPKSEISQVVLVQGDYLLQEAAAIFADESQGKDRLSWLLETRAVRFGVDRLEIVDPEFKKYAVMLDSIADNKLCYVIYLPPVYVVKVTDKKWE